MMPPDERHVILADAETKMGSDRAVLYPRRPAEPAFPECGIRIIARDVRSISLYAPETQPFAAVDTEGVLLDGSCFFMKKGETRSVKSSKPACTEKSVVGSG